MLSSIDFNSPLPDCPPDLSACYRLLSTVWRQAKQQLSELEADNVALKVKLNTNSQNSSLSPSSDNIANKAKQRQALADKQQLFQDGNGRKQGGQPGHVGKSRSLLSIEEVDQIIPCYPDILCDCCGGQVFLDKLRQRKQIISIVDNHLHIIEYQLYAGNCQCVSRATLPHGVSKGLLDASALALIATLTGKYCLSKVMVQSLLSDFYGLTISVGTISNAEAKVSQALEKPVEAIANAIQQASHLNVDETSHLNQQKLGWLWVASDETLTYYKIFARRNQESAKSILGENYQGIITTDRFGAYNWLPDSQRQYCWAHLKRDFHKLIDHGEVREGLLGCALNQSMKDILSAYYHIEANINQTAQQISLRGHIATFYCLLRRGRQLTGMKAAKFCKKLIQHRKSLWHFLIHKHVEPTNNHAERQLRHPVIWRKISYGTQSVRGMRYVKRILTIVKTCQQQNKNVISLIKDCVKDYWINRDYSMVTRANGIII